MLKLPGKLQYSTLFFERGGKGMKMFLKSTVASFDMQRCKRKTLTSERYCLIRIFQDQQKNFAFFTCKKKCWKLLSFVFKNMVQGSMIITEKWRGCLRLRTLVYTHFSIYHRRAFVDSENTGIYTHINWNKMWCLKKIYHKLIIFRCFKNMLIDICSNIIIDWELSRLNLILLLIKFCYVFLQYAIF